MIFCLIYIQCRLSRKTLLGKTSIYTSIKKLIISNNFRVFTFDEKKNWKRAARPFACSSRNRYLCAISMGDDYACMYTGTYSHSIKSRSSILQRHIIIIKTVGTSETAKICNIIHLKKWNHFNSPVKNIDMFCIVYTFKNIHRCFKTGTPTVL